MDHQGRLERHRVGAIESPCNELRRLGAGIGHIGAAAPLAGVGKKSPGEIKFDGKLIDGTNPRMNEQCNAIVDTGNSNALGLPQFLHDLVVQNMYLYQKYVKNPACVTSADFKLFPDIVIRFTNDQEISIAPKDYAMFGLSNPNNTGEITPDNLCWSMHSGINVLPSNTNIGVAFLQKYYVWFSIAVIGICIVFFFFKK